MFHQAIDTGSAVASVESPVRRDLALLAAGLDTRFLRVGTTLATAVEMIDRVIGGLDGVIAALDEKTAGVAVANLRQVAEQLTALPERQVDRSAGMSAVAGVARTLNEHVLEMHQTLRVLAIYGINIKIAASGHPQFVDFVDGMSGKLEVGDRELEGFIVQLRDLMASVSGVQQADRLLAAESGKIGTAIPARLGQDASDLAAHLATVATLARNVSTIARSVQTKVAVVLGALQVGDSTRQRLEHVVSTLQILETHAGAHLTDPAVGSHIRRLAIAQIEAAMVDFARETAAMLTSLGDLLPDTSMLLDLIIEQGGTGGRAFLNRLEQGITDIEHVTLRLRDTEGRSRALMGIIPDTVAELSRRLSSVQDIRVNVQDIATNTRLLCRRHGSTGRAVSVIATEVDAYAVRLGATTVSVGKSIGVLSDLKTTLCAENPDAEDRDFGETLASALSVIRRACQKTEQATSEGGDDVRQLSELLVDTGAELGQELKIRDALEAIIATIPVSPTVEPFTDEADAALRVLLPRIFVLYTMAQERTVHADFLLPGMDVPAAAAAPAEDDDDDGLF